MSFGWDQSRSNSVSTAGPAREGDVNLDHIRYFLALADQLHFTQAAEELGISQPALTKAIQKLESDFGGVLLHRDGKHSRLTELGRSLRSEFEGIVSRVEKAQILADAITGGEQINLNIGISNTLGPVPIVGFLAALLNQIPQARLTIHEAPTMELPGLVLAGSLDFCICSDCDISSPKISAIPLFQERLLLGCASSHRFASDHEVPIAALAGEVYLDRLHCEFRLRAAEALRQHDVMILPQFQSDREEWIQHLLQRGLGVALMPEFTVRLPGIVLRPVRGLSLLRGVHFVSVSGPTPSKAAAVAADIAAGIQWPSAGRE